VDAVVQGFADLVWRADVDISMPAAALALARVAYPDLDPVPHLARLQTLCEEAAAEVAGAGDKVGRLGDVMFDRFGFRGNRDDYADPRNSFLNDVLERRLGIPISLALVYMEVAHACDLPCEGVGFPGHFLVRELVSGRLLDVFDAGRILTTEDCRRLLLRQGMAGAGLRSQFLAGVTRMQMLARMINNLRIHYTRTEDLERAQLLVSMGRVLDEIEADDGALRLQ
jgi:regulator of sirC expression with transglutaminase-like and TPR domain